MFKPPSCSTSWLWLVIFVGLLAGPTNQLEPARAESIGAAHERVSCSNCHRARGVAVASTKVARAQASRIASPSRDLFASVDSRACLDCHGNEAGRSGNAFHGISQRACTDCHSYHDTNALRLAGSRTLRPSDMVIDRHCRSCHSAATRLDALLAGHRGVAAEFYHSNIKRLESMSPSEACLACHARESDVVVASTGGAIAFHERATHPFGVSPRGSHRAVRRPIDSRLRLIDGKIECQTCHLMGSDDGDLLVPFEDRYGLCQGCHLMNDEAR